MLWKHSQANLCTGSNITVSAASTIKVNLLPGVWTSLRYLPTVLHVDILHRDTHTHACTFCGMLQGVRGAKLVNRCNVARGEIERHSRKAPIHVRQHYVCVSTTCEPDRCQAASCKKQEVCVPKRFSINSQIYPHLLATPRQAPTPDLGNSSSPGGLEKEK